MQVYRGWDNIIRKHTVTEGEEEIYGFKSSN